MTPARIEYHIEINKDPKHKEPTHASLIVSVVGKTEDHVEIVPTGKKNKETGEPETKQKTTPGVPIYSADIGSVMSNGTLGPLFARAEGTDKAARLALAVTLEKLAAELRR